MTKTHEVVTFRLFICCVIMTLHSKHQAESEREPLFDKRTHALALGCAVITLILFFALPSEEQQAEPILEDTPPLQQDYQPPSEGEELDSEELDSEELDSEELDLIQESEPDLSNWHTTTVQAGDSLSAIFTRLGLSREDLYTLMASGPEAKTLEQIRPGQVFKIRTDEQGVLLELIHEVNPVQGIRAIREGDHFTLSKYTREPEKRTSFNAGQIKSSFYQSAYDAGLSESLIMALVEIFGWDIDFALDIRPDDHFTVIYEEHYIAGKKHNDGQILAAEFSNQDQIYRAVRYTDPTGNSRYLTPEGWVGG